ncbi:kelch-like protein 18 [Apostichopus japonicus]|uniref:kelch-like protein 18 n=1 Tax=Stichopus japonicus TaxID=307972 RepID=UPI003AB6FCBC
MKSQFSSPTRRTCMDDPPPEHVTFVQENVFAAGFASMQEIRRMGKLCDVTLKVGDQKLSAHKIVLAACIPYFKVMFTKDMKESKQGEITMNGIEPSALEAMVNFAYSGELDVTTDNVQSLLVCSNFLQLAAVKDACCEFLTARLDPNNCLGIYKFAQTLMCSSLCDASAKFLQRQFTDISYTEEFMALTHSEIRDILKRDDISVPGEELVFEALIRWLKYDIEERRLFLPELLSWVRLPLIRPQILRDKVGSNELVLQCHKCRDLVDEARDFHLLPERRNQLPNNRSKRRLCREDNGFIYAVGGLTRSGQSLMSVELYDPATNTWKEMKSMTTPRSRVGVTVLNGKLYAVGGYDGISRLNTVEVFDPIANEWWDVKAMNHKRSALGVTALGSRVYACGGYDGDSSLSSVECYDPETNRWYVVSDMTKSRSAAGVALLDNEIFVVGGHDGLQIFNLVECFNQFTGRWTAVPSMLTKRCRLGVTAYNSKLYVCGGYNGSKFLNTMEVFDPYTNKWSFTAPMSCRRSRVALVVNGGKLYAVGGYDGLSNLNTVEMYDPKLDRWSFVAPMKHHEGGVGVGVIPHV